MERKRKNKLILFTSAFFLLTTGSILGQSTFQPVESTGLPYHVIVTNLQVDGVSTATQVEIGIFDDTLCVGATTTSIAPSGNIELITWEGNADYGLKGFTPGNAITIRLAVYEYSEMHILQPEVTFQVGDGIFGYGSYSVVSLSATIVNVPQIEVDPLSLSFGAVTVGESATASFTVRNMGSALLQVAWVSSPSGFSVTPYSFSVAEEDSQQVVVTFTPSVQSLYQGDITISSDDPINSQVTVSASGIGLVEGTPNLQLIPTSLNFGQVLLGDSQVLSVTVSNAGSVPLEITGMTITNARFAVDDVSVTLDAGEDTLVSVTFSPTITGQESGQIYVYHNDGSVSNPYTLYVSGYGYESHFDPVPETGLPYQIIVTGVTLDGQALAYGSELGVFDGVLCVGSAVYLGSYPLQVVAWEADAAHGLAGFTAVDFISFRTWTTVYGMQAEVNLSSSFSEGDGLFGTGSFSAVSLSAETNLESVIAVHPTVLNFESTELWESDTLHLLVSNTGVADLTVSSINADNYVFQVSPYQFTVASGDTQMVAVTFTPQTSAFYEGTLTVQSNDPASPARQVSLSGLGLPVSVPVIFVPVNSLHFGDVVVGDTVLTNVSVFNDGSDTLHITNISSSSSSFVAQMTNLSLAPGASVPIPVQFTPATIGLHNATLTIYSDASNNSAYPVNVSGFGYTGFFEEIQSTGQSYQIVVSAVVDSSGYGLSEGDEIGVFDGSLCVGVGVYHGASSINIAAWQALPEFGLAGFVEGHLIQYRYFHPVSGTDSVFDALPDYAMGDGTFGDGILSEVALTVFATTTPLIPIPPQHLTATPDDEQILLAWLPNLELDIHKYNIYGGTISPAITLIDSVIASSPPDTSYIATGLTNGEAYYYRITAVDSSGTQSGFSNEVSATPVSKEIALSESDHNFGNVQVDSTASWTLHIRNIGTDTLIVSNITNTLSAYSISTTSGNVNPGDSLSVTVTFLPSAVTPYPDTLRVYSNDSDTADTLKSVVLIGSGVDNLAPEIPQNLIATPGNTQITLKWNKNTETDFAKYIIYGGTSTNPTTKVDSTTSISDTTKTIISLTNGTTYYYHISAVDSSGNESGFSNEVSAKTIVIPLNTGWNLISWDVDTPNDSVGVILSDIMDNVVVILGFEAGGLTYDPDWPQFNTLELADHLHAYWIKTTEPDTLIIGGAAVGYDTPITVVAGWNLVSYLPDNPDSVAHAFGSILDQVIVVLGFNEGGFTYDPNWPQFSNLQILYPGFGYWIKMTEPGTLVYPDAQIAAGRLLAKVQDHISSGRSILYTNEWVSVLGDGVLFNSKLLKVGTVIQAKDPDGIVCGQYIVETEGCFGMMPVYRDDPKTDMDEGAEPGDEIRIYFNSVEVNEKFIWGGFGEVYRIGINHIQPALPITFALSQNYPNPFNPITHIQYQVPKANHITITVFNIRGQYVKTVIDEWKKPGYHSVIWNGKDEFGKEVSSGVYFYRMTAGKYLNTKKMIILR